MCHAMPARVIAALPGEEALVEISGARQKVSTTLVGPVAEGEYLLIHVGFALGRVNPAAAAETLAALDAIGRTAI